MKKSYILFVLLALVMVFTQACNNGGGDNNNTTNPSTTNQDLLKTWKASSVLEGSLDITSEFSQYRITFSETNGSKDFTLVQRDGTSLTGTWSLSTDNTTITLTTGGNTITLSGVSISATQLKYTADEQGKAGTVNLSFTLIPA